MNLKAQNNPFHVCMQGVHYSILNQYTPWNKFMLCLDDNGLLFSTGGGWFILGIAQIYLLPRRHLCFVRNSAVSKQEQEKIGWETMQEQFQISLHIPTCIMQYSKVLSILLNILSSLGTWAYGCSFLMTLLKVIYNVLNKLQWI